MEIGIWSMHYLGMLAFELPVSVQYDWPTVAASLLAAILASLIALHVASQETMGAVPTALRSIFMGAAIAGMHYIGMAAMRLPAMCHYSTTLANRRPAFSAGVAARLPPSRRYPLLELAEVR